MNADMAIVLGCGICPNTRNTLIIVQTVPCFTVEEEKKETIRKCNIRKLGIEKFINKTCSIHNIMYICIFKKLCKNRKNYHFYAHAHKHNHRKKQ
jgi:hypothetical protein